MAELGKPLEEARVKSVVPAVKKALLAKAAELRKPETSLQEFKDLKKKAAAKLVE
jgi:hypothetical protein